MRQVKLRYWNKSRVLKQGAFINHLNKYVARNDKHLMQYTGLFDKQGVEIYKGDIVKCPIGIGYIDCIERYFRIFRPFVFSTNLCNETNSDDLDAKNKVEVIGSIYENKKLLTHQNRR